ncbi:hypothetical protein [Pseudomonas sp.]|uniref:phage adaptor protein n=1 Tax=Pseudomonas sp. TaxID=306 RepID=UPI00258A276B|nr:hypothetical protein [Pseudomonas sp.]
MTYAQLLAKVAQWMSRDDLTARIPDFIELTEERLNRHLRVRQMETAMPATALTDGLITPASDVIDAKVLWATGYETTPLAAQSLESVISSGSYGPPSMYAWEGSSLRVDGVGSVQGVLYVRIPALSTASTNWLSEQAPSLYLFGALFEAAQYVGDDPSLWQERFDQALSDLQGNDQRRPGPLVARPR